MSNFTFDIALGAVAEKIRDDVNDVGILLLKVAEADGTMKGRATITDLLAGGNTEADFTNYVRKTAITGSVSVNTGTHVVTVDMPDAVWTSAGGASNNSLVKAVVFYDQGGTDATRIPLTAHDLSVTTDGTNYTISTPATGFWQGVDFST